MVGRAFQRSLGHSFRSSQRRSIVISPLCGRITRHNLFITADLLFAASHAAAPPPLGERELNCFWLIKALDFQQVVSKPGASYDAGREPYTVPTRQDVGSCGASVLGKAPGRF